MAAGKAHLQYLLILVVIAVLPGCSSTPQVSRPYFEIEGIHLGCPESIAKKLLDSRAQNNGSLKFFARCGSLIWVKDGAVVGASGEELELGNGRKYRVADIDHLKKVLGQPDYQPSGGGVTSWEYSGFELTVSNNNGLIYLCEDSSYQAVYYWDSHLRKRAQSVD